MRDQPNQSTDCDDSSIASLQISCQSLIPKATASPDAILEIDIRKSSTDNRILCRAREKIGVSEIRLHIMLGEHLNKHYKQTERKGDEDHRSKRRKSVEEAPHDF